MQSDESSQVPSSQPSSMPSSMPSEQASMNATKATRPGNPPGINKLKTNSATIDTGGEDSDINVSVSPTPKPTRKGNPPGINKLKTNSDTVSNNDINVIKGGRGKKKQNQKQKDGHGKKKQTQKDGRGKKKKQNNNNSRPIKKTTNIGNQNQKQKQMEQQQQIKKNQQVKKAQQMEKKQTLKQQYMAAMQAHQDNNMVTLDGTLSEAGGIQIQTGDLYRTCLDRLQNTGTGFTYENLVHTNMSPFVARNEQLMQGTMYISLLQDSTEMNDKAIQQMEEFTLSYLADNIGGNNF